MSAAGAAAESSGLREALRRALVSDGDRLYALALRVTRDPDLAADALQEAFTSALDRGAGFRGEASVSTWLHRITYNKSVDQLRRRGRETALPEEEDGAPHESVMTAPDPAPDDVVSARETREALEQALGRLTPVQRAVFELREAEGRPAEEVAAILEMPPGTVRVHLHRARLKLRSLLAPHFRGRQR
jgi:RNA polymerase sigma-70 factor, ECF subfamily